MSPRPPRLAGNSRDDDFGVDPIEAVAVRVGHEQIARGAQRQETRSGLASVYRRMRQQSLASERCKRDAG